LHEQTAAQIELMRAQGATAVEVEALKEKEIQAELDLTTASIAKAQADSDQAKVEYSKAEKAYASGQSSADVIKSAKDKADEAGSVLEAVQKAHDAASITVNTGQSTMGPNGASFPVLTSRQANDTDKFDVEVNGKKFGMSLADARQYYDKLSGTASDLAAAQEKLKKDYEDAGSTVDQRNKDLAKLHKTEQDYKDQLEIAKKFGGPAAAAEDAKKASEKANKDRVSGYGLNAQQRVGAYAATPPIWKEQLNELKGIRHALTSGGNRMEPPGARRPQMGPTIDRGTYGHHQDR
jgi:hypothetical protein